MSWTTFFFESNQFFDHISGMKDWERLRAAYPSMCDEQLLSAREATYRGSRIQEERDEHPNYGFRSEHDGDRRLRDFFEAHGMTIPGAKPPIRDLAAWCESEQCMWDAEASRDVRAYNREHYRQQEAREWITMARVKAGA